MGERVAILRPEEASFGEGTKDNPVVCEGIEESREEGDNRPKARPEEREASTPTGSDAILVREIYIFHFFRGIFGHRVCDPIQH